MRNNFNSCMLLMVILCLPVIAASQNNSKQALTTIEFFSDNIKDGDSLKLYTFPVNDYLNEPDLDKKEVFAKATAGKLHWEVNTQEALYMAILIKKKNIVGILEPGDNIVIQYKNGKRTFSGKGAMKLKIKDDMDSAMALIAEPSNRSDSKTESVEDYLEWNTYLNQRLKVGNAIFDSYRTKVSASSLKYLRAIFIDQNIDDRSDKFMALNGYVKKKSLDLKILCDIYDTAYLPSVKEPFKFTSSYLFNNYKPILFACYRKQGFDVEKDTKQDKLNWTLIWYSSAINTYKGMPLQKFVLDILEDKLAKDYGFTPEVENLYKAYYASNPPEAFRKAVRKKELKLRERINGYAPVSFTLTDREGKAFSSDRLKGKIAVMDFWFTGCAGCVPMATALKKLEHEFAKDTNVVFVKISIDQNKEKWIRSVAQGKYTGAGGIHLYTGGSGDEHDIITKFGVSGYPELVVMDMQGRIIPSFRYNDPRNDNGKELTFLLKKQLSILQDGPYLFYEKDSLTAYAISGNNLSVKKYPANSSYSLSVQTDELKPFAIEIKKSLQPEKSVYEKAGKLFALSDIEGNFDAFRKLLQANKIIDENYNWTFGNGHLVFAGDMFDRGEQVTECLWLMYSLEEKAKAAGGYVHFVLGNHEVMNMQERHQYVQEKYKQNAQLMGKSLTELHAGNTELGRWLKTKNIVEIIGDLLFAHGGIGVEFNDSVSLSIPEINQAFRDNMRKNIKYNDPDVNVRMIFSDNYGPYWHRLYYSNSDKHLEAVNDTSVKFTIIHPSMAQMDRILDRWKVKHIITGHTIVADKISVHYNNKVINTDTKHAGGKSEALLIEGPNFYRVNAEGKRELLFSESAK